MFGGKLRNKIFLMMALVSIVPVLIAGFLSVYSITLSHRTDVANLEDALIDQTYGEIRSFMEGAVGFLKLKVVTTAEQTINMEAITERYKRLLLTEALKEFSALEEVSVINLDGKETARFGRLHPEGVSEDALRDQSQLQKFLVAKEGNDYIGPVYYTPKGPMVTAASPTIDKDGVTISIIAGEINLKNVQNIVRGTRLGESGYLYLVDSDGFLIGGGLREVPPSSGLKGIGLVSRVIAGEDILGPTGQSRYQNFSGEKVVAAARFLPEYNWSLIAEWPVREADAGVNDLLYKNLIVSIAVVLAVILASILLATLIVRPIRELEEGTKRVAEGKFDEGVRIKTGDELEGLGSAFNEMMAGLKRLEELKDEFVFIAAHELRTPVAAMKGYLTLVLDGTTGAITEKTRDFIQKVINSNQRLIQLVNDLLEVSRSEAGRLTIEVSPVDITTPIREVLTELTPMAEKQSVELRYEMLSNLFKVMADPDRLKEVMVNLIGNSIKYMGPASTRSPRGEAASLGEAGGSGSVVISHELAPHELITHIKDTGVGMSEEAQKKLFEKFYRIQDEKTRGVTGTGLGLFIVKEIIEKMGGKIWAYSEGEGRGSTFSFSLPVAGSPTSLGSRTS